jgi:hypothetical protein
LEEVWHGRERELRERGERDIEREGRDIDREREGEV